MSTILKILMTKAGDYFSRDVLEDLLPDFGPVPSQRTLDSIFAKLPDQPGVRVERHSYTKVYGYFPEEGKSFASEASGGDLDLDEEEQQWQELDAELQAKKVARAKDLLKKMLLPQLEEIKKKMQEEMND